MRRHPGRPAAIGAAFCAAALIIPAATAASVDSPDPDESLSEDQVDQAAVDDDHDVDGDIDATTALQPGATDHAVIETISRDVPTVSEDTFTVTASPGELATFDALVDTADGDPVAQSESILVDVDGLRVVGVGSDDADVPLSVALRSEGGEDGPGWSEWVEYDFEAANDEPDARAGTDPIAVIGADRIEIQILADSGTADLSGFASVEVEIAVIDPGYSADDELGEMTDADAAAEAASVTSPPTIRDRAAWGADETQRRWRPVAGRVTGGIVHHTAGTNNYTQGQVPGIIRGIYHYHANTLNWGDIGYNILVDRYGRAWEGRYGGLENAVIAGHALGANTTTFGVGMLGHYESTNPPQAAVDQVARVIGWKFSVHGITNAGRGVGVDGAPIPRITGHRDVSATLCPGQRMYNRLGEVRTKVEQYQAANRPRNLGPLATVRLAGANRSATSVAIGAWTPQPGNRVYIATRENFPDALAVASPAARQRAAVLLVQHNNVPAVVRDELSRRNPSSIVVLGGSSVVSNSVLTQLRSYSPSVTRMAGSNRYGTAATIATTYFGQTSTNEVWIAEGADFADALSAGPGAARRSAPILLTRPTSLTPETRAALRHFSPSRVRIIGGEAAVPASVMREIRAVVPGAQVQRISGPNRAGTAAAVASHVWPNGSSNVHFAQAGAWPDAVTGSSAAGALNSPLLLVGSSCAPAATVTATSRLNPSRGWVLGGSAVIRPGAEQRRC